MIPCCNQLPGGGAEDSAGFTILELLIAMSLTGLIMAMVLGHLLAMRQGYFDDAARTRLNSNLRTALDIVSMNIRQAGENLQERFPAVILTDGDGVASDSLSLRRNLVPEVITLCDEAEAGETAVSISSLDLDEPECTFSNVAPLFSTFETYRSSAEEPVRAFIYNRVSGTGEFIDYLGGGETGGEHYLNISALENEYPALTSNIYLVEEFRFERNVEEDTLELFLNGLDEPQTVAFSVTGFEVALLAQDGTTLTSLGVLEERGWKDLRHVEITLSGEEERRFSTLRSSVSARYFPRNVLSN